MLIIKVWCLPPMPETKLRELHKNIVTAVVGIKELSFKDETDMVCLFPSDMMSYGLGEEIVVEVTGLLLSEEPRDNEGARELAIALGDTVHTLFPNAAVDCRVYLDNPTQVSWSSPR